MGFLLQLLKSSKKALGEKRTDSLDSDGTSSLLMMKTVKSTFLDFIDECRREYLQQSTLVTTGSTNEEKDSQQSSPNSQGSTSAGGSPALDSLSDCSTSPACPSTSSFCSIAEVEGRDQLPSPGLASTAERRLFLEARENLASNQEIQTQSTAIAHTEDNAINHSHEFEQPEKIHLEKVKAPQLPFSFLLCEALKATAVDAQARKQRLGLAKRSEVAASTSPQKRLRFTASEGLVRSI